MRLLSGNPGMYQHSVEHNTEGETTQREPEHGEDTIARVKGMARTPEKVQVPVQWLFIYQNIPLLLKLSRQQFFFERRTPTTLPLN